MRKIYALFLAALLFGVNASAEDEPEVLRPVTAAYTIEGGTSHIADTYLSPIKYSGWTTSLRYERMQAMKFSPDRWVMQLAASVSLQRALNYVGNSTMWYAGVDFSWGMMRRWQVTPGLTLAIGGEAAADLGGLYAMRNGNNPVSAKAAVTIGATGYAAYNMKIGRLPVTLCWQPSLPVTGVFFSPDYGELYYEIYLGDHDNLVHCAWWGNYFRLDNALTADLHFGATSLRVGYRGMILSTKVNNLVSRHFTHSAVIGVSGEWLSLNPRRRMSPKARIVNALFQNQWK
ncbi:MAG: DUF3316 domain-containing protein [Paramuribaculum sp.]|nr:DUF3316 domain-containing protein [Paramuribaculum sp.]